MKKYIWASLITILMFLLIWNMTDSIEETNYTSNNTVEENQGYQVGLLQTETKQTRIVYQH